MWDRKVLKEKGKAAFRANRVTCILAGFLLTLVTGGLTVPVNVNSTETVEQLDIPPEVLKMIIAAAGVLTIIVFLLEVFVFNPVLVGLRKYFYDNSHDTNTGLDRKNIGVAFSDGNYTNVVAAMFTKDLFVFLWSMLFLVPGIIKSIAWRLVPYILAENPEMTGTEARLISERMMYGSKWAAFVLDLSFLGWKFLGALTLGIINLIWTNPYEAATEAELYRYLKGDDAAEPAVTVAAEVRNASEGEEFRADEDDDVSFMK